MSRSSENSYIHPLDQLSPRETQIFLDTAKAYFVEKFKETGDKVALKSIYMTLLEPPKEEVLKFIGVGKTPDEVVPEFKGPLPARRAEGVVIEGVTGDVYELELTLDTDTNKAKVDKCEKLPEGVFPMISPNELGRCIEIIREDATVQKLAADIGLTPEQIDCDAWTLGFDYRVANDRRLFQGLMYARIEENRNHYGHPLDFIPLVDMLEEKVIAIDFPSHSVDNDSTTGYSFKNSGPRAPSDIQSVDEMLKYSGRERYCPNIERTKEYLPEFIKQDTPETKFREPVKPINITQPEGVSFQVKGNRILWENWDFHVGFNVREGVTINTIKYYDAQEDKVRPLFYRLSCVEMIVPYGDPQWPHPRKHAFDAGEYGLGFMANSLELGCDCLGAIHYMDGVANNNGFDTYVIKNAICIHEEDDGFLWKHTDIRPGGRTHTVRSRKLIVQFIATLANYEYAFQYIFRQDASIEVEVRLTGILNTYLAYPGERNPYATTVAAGVAAQHHQHLFSLYINPMLDGYENSAQETDVVPTDAPTGSEDNYAGNGFYPITTTVETTAQGVRDPDLNRHRSWGFVNLNKKHPHSGKPIGYKILPNSMPPLLARPDSVVGRRGQFATHGLWLAPQKDGQLYPAGKHITQARESRPDSVGFWVKGDKPLKQKDISAWLTIGVTHIARPEDFPVMPKEWVNVMIKPSNFFVLNPSNDILPQTNKTSVLAFGDSDPEKQKACCNPRK